MSPPNGFESLETQALLSSDEDDDEELSLPSAGVANVRGQTPESEDEDVSEEDEDVDIGELDWGDADKEVNDFLAEIGEDAVYTTDESDNERFLNSLDLRLIIVWHQMYLNHEENGNGNDTTILPVKLLTPTIQIPNLQRQTSVLVSQNEFKRPTPAALNSQSQSSYQVVSPHLKHRPPTDLHTYGLPSKAPPEEEVSMEVPLTMTPRTMMPTKKIQI